MFYGWRVVAGTFVSQLFVTGFFTYAFSLFVPLVRQEFGASLEAVMYSMTASVFLGLFMTPVAGVLVDRFPVRWLMTAGGLWFAAGLWLLSKTHSVYQFVAVFAVTTQVAVSLATSLPTSAVISRWFTASRGKALGIAAVGTSVGGIVIPRLVAQWLPEVGWRGTLENLALVSLLVMVPFVALTVRGRPSDVGLEPESDHKAVNVSAAEDFAMSVSQILKSKGFWLLSVSLGLLFSTYSAMLSNMTPYAVDLGHTEEQAANLIMAVALAGFTGKILFGMAADKFSLKAALAAAMAMVTVGFLILAAEPVYLVIVLACVSMGLAGGGILPVWGAMMARVFGLMSYGRAMGLMGPVMTLLIMPGFTVAGRLFDATGTFTTVLLIFSALVVLAMFLLWPLKLVRA